MFTYRLGGQISATYSDGGSIELTDEVLIFRDARCHLVTVTSKAFVLNSAICIS